MCQATWQFNSENVPKCAAHLLNLVHDAGRSAWRYVLVVTMCRRCGHWVQAEIGATDGRGILTYFDDDGTSGSYGEHVARRPGCGQGLVVEGLQGSPPVAVSLTARELAEALGIPAEAARALVSSAATGGGRKAK